MNSFIFLVLYSLMLHGFVVFEILQAEHDPEDRYDFHELR